MSNRPVYLTQIRSWDSLPAVLTLSQAAVLLQVPEDTLRHLLRSGKLPGFKIGSQWRISKDMLREKASGFK